MEDEILAEQIKTSQLLKKDKADVVWREHMARQRVKQLETESNVRILNVKSLLFEEILERERILGKDFQRAKQHLETDIKKQEASLREKYGDLGADVILHAVKLYHFLS